MKVTLGITCWNGKNLLKKNLPLILKATSYSPNMISEVLVVDDASADDSVQYLSKQFPKIKIFVQPKNLGYAATCNRIIKEATNSLVVIINADVVPQNNFLVSALKHFEKKDTFSVSFNEGKYGPGKLCWKKGFLEITSTDLQHETAVTDWPSGGSSIFSKDLWRKIGGMDELFLPFYFEDVDLGIRAKEAGFHCWWEPRALVAHQHEATINSENFNPVWIRRIKERNHLLLTWKNTRSLRGIVNHICCLAVKLIFHPGYWVIFLMALSRVINRKFK